MELEVWESDVVTRWLSIFPQSCYLSHQFTIMMSFEKEINTVLQARRADTDMINIVEALGYPSEKFQQAFDIALQMENRNLVKLLYSNFNAGKIIVEFTLLAKK